MLGLFVYLIFTNYLNKNTHLQVIVIPLLLSFSSSFILSFMKGEAISVFLSFAIIVSFLFLFNWFKEKLENSQNEEVDLHFYLKRLVLPFTFPIALYFIVATFFNSEAVTYVYSMFYFFVLIYYSRYILTTFYLLFFVGMQSAILFYLFQFVEIISFTEKTMLIGLVIINSVYHFYYNNQQLYKRINQRG